MSAPSIPEQINYLLRAIKQGISYYQDKGLTIDKIIERLKS